MKVTATAARTVALWGVFNLVLVCTLLGFGEAGPVMAMAMSMVGLVFVIAALAWLSHRRHPDRSRYRQDANGDSVVIFALGVLLAGFAIAFYPFLAPVALVPIGIAALREISARRGGL